MFGREIFCIAPCSLASTAGSVPRRLWYGAGDKVNVLHVLRGESKKFMDLLGADRWPIRPSWVRIAFRYDRDLNSFSNLDFNL